MLALYPKNTVILSGINWLLTGKLLKLLPSLCSYEFRYLNVSENVCKQQLQLIKQNATVRQ